MVDLTMFLAIAEYLVHLQDRFWVIRCSSAWELTDRSREVFVSTHNAPLPIAQKVS
jgi:hypothetical protein